MGASFTVLGGSFIFLPLAVVFKYELKRITTTTIIITPPTGTFVKIPTLYCRQEKKGYKRKSQSGLTWSFCD